MFRWLNKNKFINNKNTPTTHTLMSGGIIGIPDDKYQDFLHMYSREMGKNKSLTFSELRSTPVSKMYFDVDLLDEETLGEGFVSTMASTIQSVIRSYYTEEQGNLDRRDTFKCVVCTTPPKSVTKDGMDLTKNGFHIIFPFLNIDLEKAYQLRFNVVYELEKIMGKRVVPSNPWADAIDKAPYKGGLKMCGSFKMVNCTSCKDSKKEKIEEEKSLKKDIGDLRKKLFPREEKFNYYDVSTLETDEFKDSLICELNGKLLELSAGRTCPLCHNGRRIEDRTYMPALVLDSDGSRNDDLLESMLSDTFKTMKYTSIRCQGVDEVTPGFKKPMGVPLCPDESNSANLRNLERSKILKMGKTAMMEVLSEGVFKRDEDTVFTWKGPQVFDTEKIRMVEEFIQGLTCGHYKNIQVKTIFEHTILKRGSKGGKSSSGSNTINSIIKSTEKEDISEEKSLLVRVAGEGSTFCQNKEGEHTSNSIFFRFVPQFCYQKCFSRSEIVRAGRKKCGDYRSQGVPIPHSLGKMLFPEENIPVPATSTMSFSRIDTASKRRAGSGPCRQESLGKKPKMTSIWGARLLD